MRAPPPDAHALRAALLLHAHILAGVAQPLPRVSTRHTIYRERCRVQSTSWIHEAEPSIVAEGCVGVVVALPREKYLINIQN
jgi:hypothetical protein